MKTTSANRPYDIISNIIYFEGISNNLLSKIGRSAFLLIRHLKYSTILSKIHSYSYCFLGDFAH